MLENLKIKHKITLTPVIAGATFIVIVFILIILNNYNKSLSNKIQTYYYPLLENVQTFDNDFALLQRSLQDAVATADSSEIENADFTYNSLLANIKNVSSKYSVEEPDFKKLYKDLEDYYVIAKDISYRMISEATDEKLVNDLELMTKKYNLINAAFSNQVIYYQQLISDEFNSLNDNQNISLYIIIIATVLAVGLIGWISSVLIKSITHPLNDVVGVANEFGSGNLDVEFTVSSQDEFGVLKEAFREMIIQIKKLIKEKDHTLTNLKSEFKVRKKAEKELEKHKNHLEELVKERTLELEKANINLQKEIGVRKKVEAKQSQLIEEIESINQELKNFAYIVSHDLKAPLRAIGSLSDWLRKDYADKLDDEGFELLRLLDTRVKRMHNLIEGILQYSRVGRVMEEKVKVNLNTSVENIIDSIAPPDNISVKILNKLPSVMFEKTRIEQVFQNLLSNAIKYMDKPEGKINIGTSIKNGNLNIFIEDNGPGIEEKYYDKIFQIFQTLNARDNFESTGVGLSLVKKIIDMNGGKIWVESEVNKGSTFYFSLPKKIVIESKKRN